MQLRVVWYHRLIGETEGPALITDTACTATYCRFPSWHTDNYLDTRRIPSAIRKLSHMLASPLRSSGYLFRIIIGRPTRYHPLSALMRLSGILAGIVVLAAVMLATGNSPYTSSDFSSRSDNCAHLPDKATAVNAKDALSTPKHANSHLRINSYSCSGVLQTT